MEKELFISESFNQNQFEPTQKENWLTDYPAINNYLKKGYSLKSFTVTSFPFKNQTPEITIEHYLIVHAHLILA